MRFWFGERGAYGAKRDAWFKKDAAFDDLIRERFLSLYEAGAAGALAPWKSSAAECLALVVTLDQFPRNLFRGAARAFASDALALATARHALAQGFERALLPVERQFLYLPFEHSESLADQERYCALVSPLTAFAETADVLEWGRKHLEIVRRFGRFPHRNAALGRRSSAEELAFLEQPGSSF